MSLEAARKHLDLASEQWERACSDWWDPPDPASCVTNVFYAYENLLVAAAEAHSLKWTKNHYAKAKLAAKLFSKGILSEDLSDEMLRLNDLRKDVSYGEPGVELDDEDLESLVSRLEGTLEAVKAIVTAMEEKAGDE